MKPLKLTLRGFRGIKAGLNTDEVTLDLQTVNGQLVALTGPNGSGKSTLLDNLHPFRIMPSRASSYAVGGFSYADQTYLADTKKQLLWEHDGVTYESTILVKGKSRKQEAYLAVVTPDAKRPMTLADGTIADGKTTSYDACIESILGSPELFFTSAFSCQGRPTLAEYTTGDVKELMTDLLGLDRLRELSGEANERAKGFRARLDAMRAQIARANQLQAEHTESEAEILAAEQQLQDLQAGRDQARGVVMRAEQRLLEARTNAAAFAETERRRESLTQQLALERAEGQRARDVLISAHRAEDAEFDTRADEVRKTLTDASADRDRAARQLGDVERLLSEKKLIEDAVAALPALDANIETQKAKIHASETALVAWQDAQRAVSDAAHALKLVEQEGKGLVITCDDVRKRAGLADDVPCHGTDLQGRCQLLREAMVAKAGLPALETELEAKRAARTKEFERWTAAKAAAEALGAAPVPAAERATLATMEANRNKMAVLAAKAPQLASLESLREQKVRDVDDAAERAQAAQARADALQKEREAITARHQAAAMAQRDAEAKRLAILQAELDALPPTDVAALREAESAHDQASSQLESAEARVAAGVARAATARERAGGLERQLLDLQGVVTEAGEVEQEIAHFTLLAKALGNDGIIALSIDDAGPTLTSIANDLLTECYGPRFSVQLITQEPNKAGVLKETFDIVVYDADRGDQKSIRDVSGGERIYVNEALTRAIGLYQAMTSGRQYGCLFSDESDGALDGEKKRQYARMKRRVLELGGYEREIFISHSAEVQECADATIYVPDLAA